MRMLLLVAVLALAAIGSAAGVRDVALSGGPDTNPPIPGPLPSIASLYTGPAGPTVTSAPNFVVRLATLSQSMPAWRHVAIRRGHEWVGVLRIPTGVTVPLWLPSTSDLRLDVLGSDALDIPVAPGSRVLIALP